MPLEFKIGILSIKKESGANIGWISILNPKKELGGSGKIFLFY